MTPEEALQKGIKYITHPGWNYGYFRVWEQKLPVTYNRLGRLTGDLPASHVRLSVYEQGTNRLVEILPVHNEYMELDYIEYNRITSD